MKEALYYERMEQNTIKCILCPHNCTIGEGGNGKCGVRQNIDGTLYSLNYGKVTSVAYDPIEKKPIYNYKPGNLIFSIGSMGCNFTCDFCQNYEIVYSRDEYIERDIASLIKKAGEMGSVGIAYTYNEPTVWYEFMLDLAIEAHENKLSNVMVTNGYINEAPFKKLLKYIDAVNIDLKSYSNKFYREICGGRLDPVKKSIELASNYSHLEVTTLLIEGENIDDIEDIAKFLASLNPEITLHISRYFPKFNRNDRPTPIDSMKNAENIARRYLRNVYLGNV